MLRYREYDRALVHGESRIEVHLCRHRSAVSKPIWWLFLQFVAIGPAWRRCCHMELALFIEAGNLGLQLTDWHHIGRQRIIATPDWHARAETIGLYSRIGNTWLSVGTMENDPATSKIQRREWRADYYRITFSPPVGDRFPCEIDAWLMREEAFHSGAPLSGAEIHRIPDSPPNLRIIGFARLASGSLTLNCRNADPESLARRRLSQTIALDDPGELSSTGWAETERKAYKLSLPPPPGEFRRCDVSFRRTMEKPASS
jgi:hypothetical protein